MFRPIFILFFVSRLVQFASKLYMFMIMYSWGAVALRIVTHLYNQVQYLPVPPRNTPRVSASVSCWFRWWCWKITAIWRGSRGRRPSWRRPTATSTSRLSWRSGNDLSLYLICIDSYSIRISILWSLSRTLAGGSSRSSRKVSGSPFWRLWRSSSRREDTFPWPEYRKQSSLPERGCFRIDSSSSRSTSNRRRGISAPRGCPSTRRGPSWTTCRIPPRRTFPTSRRFFGLPGNELPLNIQLKFTVFLNIRDTIGRATGRRMVGTPMSSAIRATNLSGASRILYL